MLWRGGGWSAIGHRGRCVSINGTGKGQAMFGGGHEEAGKGMWVEGRQEM